MADCEDEAIREGVRFLKNEFLRWRIPPVELPPDSTIAHVVHHLLRFGHESAEGIPTTLPHRPANIWIIGGGY